MLAIGSGNFTRSLSLLTRLAKENRERFALSVSHDFVQFFL